eukprot:6187476-Pyramimonas_sp.AAC.1
MEASKNEETSGSLGTAKGVLTTLADKPVGGAFAAQGHRASGGQAQLAAEPGEGPRLPRAAGARAVHRRRAPGRIGGRGASDEDGGLGDSAAIRASVSYTHLRAHETGAYL